MLAKVFRNDTAAFIPFQPHELGEKSAAGAGLQSYVFPEANTLALIPLKSAFPLHESAPFEDTFQDADDTFIAGDFTEPDRHALEHSLREQMIPEVRAALEAEAALETGRLRDELAQTIAQVSNLKAEMTAEMENDVVELALQIARKIVAREISIDREVVLSVTKKALSKLQVRTTASIHLHPDDLAYMQEHRDKLSFHGSLELVEDGSITPGGCLIHTGTGDIDGRIESQFDEIAHGLLGDVSE